MRPRRVKVSTERAGFDACVARRMGVVWRVGGCGLEWIGTAKDGGIGKLEFLELQLGARLGIS